MSFCCRKYTVVIAYEFNNGTWTERASAAETITAGTAFTLSANIRAGGAAGYATTLPAGQVGLWCDTGSGNGFDDFLVEDTSGQYEVDGRWFAEVGDVQVDSGSYADVLSINHTVAQPVPVVRRGFRAERVAWASRRRNSSGRQARRLSHPQVHMVHALQARGGIRLPRSRKCNFNAVTRSCRVLDTARCAGAGAAHRHRDRQAEALRAHTRSA